MTRTPTTRRGPHRGLPSGAAGLAVAALLAGCSADTPPESTPATSSTSADPGESGPADPAPSSSAPADGAPCTAADLTAAPQGEVRGQASGREVTVLVTAARECSIESDPRVQLSVDGTLVPLVVAPVPLPEGRPPASTSIDDIGSTTTISWSVVPSAALLDASDPAALAAVCPSGVLQLVLADGSAVDLTELTACDASVSITPWSVNAG